MNETIQEAILRLMMAKRGPMPSDPRIIGGGMPPVMNPPRRDMPEPLRALPVPREQDDVLIPPTDEMIRNHNPGFRLRPMLDGLRDRINKQFGHATLKQQ